ncbi:MAG: hypothetical protein M1836_006470 [Candelina mexicana]|nr:MAG: hypothetical protein M1836_006470 [Candelina mexicana]
MSKSAMMHLHEPSSSKHDNTGGSPTQRAGLKSTTHTLASTSEARLISFSQHASKEFSTMVDAAWAIVLSVFTGNNDISFGTTNLATTADCKNRWRVRECDIQGELSVVRLLDHLRDQTRSLVGAIDGHCSQTELHSPLTKLWGQSGTGLILHDMDKVLQPEVESCLAEVNDKHWSTRFDIVVHVYKSADELVTTLEYAAALVLEPSARSAAACFAETLASISKESNVLVRDVRMLPISEQERLLSRRKNPPAATERCLYDLLEDQVKIRPSAPAIQTSTEILSYAQLLDYSSRLAHQLLLRGVGPEVMVPFCFEKSPVAIITMIAILKAGGACVVLDPSQPMDRLDTIIREVSATTIVTSENHLDRMKGKAKNVLAVDWEYLNGLQILSSPISSVVTPGNAAFVMFTSGSTGIPKGIVLEHRSLSTSVLANAPILRVDETTRALQFAAYAFDVALEEIFTTLSQGGCVCSPSDSERQNSLVTFMSANRVTWADMTPTVASTLLNPQDVPTLQTLVLGGEALSRKIIQSWAPHVHLVAMYGPAECSINCVGNGKIGCDSDFSNLGSGLAASLWVVDPRNDQMLCPVGAVGELLIEGPILARGYLNEPKKTAAAFIKSPDWLKGKVYGSKRRLYKTGDLVRLQPGDGLSFVGRKDHQFKLRGQRVEISEIQSHLRATIPPFWQAVVEVANLRSHPSLVVYLCDSPAVTVTTNSTVARPPIHQSQELTEACKNIHSFLSQKIPSYMMPSAYIGIAWMPTLTSGKVDRRMLQKITEDLTQQDLQKFSKGSQLVTHVQPTSELETRLERLWKDCLNMDSDSIGVNDNFFEIGGDSLLAMKLVAASNALKIPLNMQLIYQWPTIQQMANNLRSQPLSKVNRSQDGDDDDFVTLSGFNSEEDYRLVAEQCQVSRSDLVDLYACSPLQESLIALSTKLPGSYVGQFLFTLPAELDFLAYQSAWTRLVMANPIMRTRIVLHQGCSLLQAVLNHAPDWVYTSDLENYLEQDRNNHMHLGSSLSRFAVVTDDGKPSHVVWTAHHAIYDGYSLELMLQQIEQLFEGKTISSSTSYKHFIRELKTQNSQVSGLFWKSYLAGALPFQFVEPQQPGHKFQLGRLPPKIVPIDEMLGQSTTISTMIRGAWAITLAQHLKSLDVVFGVVLSGRSISIPGIEGIIGPTMVTVPVRVQLDLDKTTESFLRMVQDDSVRAMPHEHYGLTNIKKSISNASVCDFGTLLVIQPHRLAETSTNDSLPKPIVVDEADRSTFPLTLECTLLPGAIQVETYFDVGLIAVEDLEKITSSFADLIQALAQSQYQLLRQITNFDHVRTSAKTNTHHSIPCPPKIERCVHELFEEQMAKDPQAPAVDSSGLSRPITYFELNRVANNIAAKLRELGVGPEVLVPFCFEKSPWVVAALLGVLKAGGATVPLDAAYPQQRTNDVISNAAANVVITQCEFQGRFCGVVEHVLILDRAAIASLPPAPRLTPRLVKPSNPAYVLFTSGSTGKPKGIIIEHAAFATSAHYHGPALAINRHSRVLQFAAYTYDVSIGEIFTTLLRGGCICVPSEHSRLNDLAGAINDMRVNWAFLTPTVAGTLSPLDVPGLETLILGGEHATCNNFATWAPHVNLINSYGPAECAIWTNRALRADAETPPDNIGHAIGCNIYIAERDNHNKLVSQGSVGELLVESHGLARGYLNEPIKTCDAFITNPSWIKISPGQSRRLYKSGDLAKVNEDGTISIIGRKDKQVKIRGQRVELGEIEHHLSANPAIRHAAVLFPCSGPFKGRLVAVLSLAMTSASRGIDEIVLLSKAEESSVRILIRELRERLQSFLPNYMVPETWAFVEHMPLTLSGKIGRAPLTAWLDSIDQGSCEHIMALARNNASGRPDNATEESLLRIWSEVLNVPAEQIGMHTPFLRAGGDSITAMQVNWKSKKRGLFLSVQDIIASESLRHLAARVSTPQKTATPKEQVGVLFALSPIQKMFFQLTKNVSFNEQCHYNQSFFVKITQQVPFARLKTAVETLVQAHSMLRARFVHQVNGLPQQLVSSNIKGSYRCVEHLVADLDSVTPIANASQKSLNIEHGPLISFDSFQTHNGQFLFAVAHHLVIDLVSWRIIFQELEELLGSQHYSPSRGLSFQAWCTAQREYALKNLSPSKVLPSVVPEPDFEFWGMRGRKNTNEAVREITLKLSEETTSHLLGNNGRDLDIETTDLFNAAVLHSFARIFPDRGPPSLFNEGHGREAWESTLDSSTCVGWFTTMFPIHASVQGTSSIMQTCHAVAQFRRGLAQKGWGYFTSRFLNPEGIEVFGSHAAEILLNFFGQYQQFERPGTLFQQVDAALYQNDVGETISRQALVDIWINVEKGHLQVSMIFNRNMRHQDRILVWTEALEHDLLQIATITGAESPSDFKGSTPAPTLTGTEAQLVTKDSLRSLGIKDLSVIEDEYPCSPMQEAILIWQDLNPELYQVQSVWKMSSKYGHLEEDRLQRAWQSVIAAHPGLRTIILPGPSGCGSHLHVVLRKRKFLDLQHLLPYKFRVTAAAKQGEFILSLEITHALIDGASISILRQDLALAYDGMLGTGERPSYHSFIEYLQSRPPSAALDYWKTYLSGVIPCQFPANRSGNRKTDTLQTRILEINSADIQDFLQYHGFTLTAFFLFIWAMVLSRHTGSANVCFGYLVSGRDYSIDAVEGIVGPFIHMLPCRMSTSPEATPFTKLKELQSGFFKALENQECSLSAMYQGLDLGGQPLFNTAVSIQKATSRTDRITGTTTVEEIGGNDPTEYDIAVNIEEQDDKIEIAFVYWAEKVSTPSIVDVASSCKQAISQVLENVHTRTKHMRLLGTETQKSLTLWNKNVPFTVDRCVHAIIHDQRLRAPLAPAICSSGENISYEQLDILSSRLAALIQQIPFGPDKLVALAIEKSPLTIITMLAVLKAGGGFIPLDIEQPSARIESIIRSSRVGLMLTTEDYAKQISFGGVRTQIVSRDLLDNSPDGKISSHCTNPSRTAYVIFTSGSTGTPKGVVIPHSALSTGAQTHGKALQIRSDSRVLQFASYSFDACIVEIMTTLLQGGCICVPTPAERLDFVSFMKRTKVNWAVLTPSLITAIHPDEVPMLKTLVLAGEAMNQEVLNQWAPRLQLINGYGPSECCVCCAFSEMNAEVDPRDIGKATGCRLWVVDANDHDILVPLGCVGELAVEGPIVAQGYLNDPEKTALAFVENAAWFDEITVDSPRRRIYKTGDLVRYNIDGTLRFVGRKDTQVKIRGQRVELGEVEQALSRECVATDSVAIISQNKRCKDRLVAILCFQDIPAVTNADKRPLPLASVYVAESRARIAAAKSSMCNKVPLYMVPDVWIAVGSLPLLPSGKVDRPSVSKWLDSLTQEELDKFALAQEATDKSSTRLLDELEDYLLNVLRRIIDQPLEARDLGKSFIALGGDSISAMRLLSICKKDGYLLELHDVFRTQHVVDLAKSVTKMDRGTADTGGNDTNDAAHYKSRNPESSATHAKSSSAVFPCSATQDSMLRSQNHESAYYTTQFIWEFIDSSGDLDLNRILSAWQNVIDRHPMLRCVFLVPKTSKDCYHQSILEHLPARSSILSSQATNVLQTLQDVPRMDYEDGSAQHRLLLIYSSPNSAFCRLEMSHAITDGTSMSVIVAELIDAYNRTLTGIAPGFETYINHLKSNEAQTHIEYWDSYISGMKPCHLPGFTSRKPVAELRTLEFQACDETLATVFCTSHGVTLSNIVSLSWAIALSTLLDTDDVNYAYITSSRDVDIDGIERLVGPLINSLPCSLHLLGAMTIPEALRMVQDDLFNSSQHQNFLPREVSSFYSANGTRPFNTLVNFRNFHKVDGSGVASSLKVVEHSSADPMDYDIVLGGHIEDGKLILALSMWVKGRNDAEEELMKLVKQIIKHLLDTKFESLDALRNEVRVD